jgi:anti-sigma factor ChrR (cupin superfamily)
MNHSRADDGFMEFAALYALGMLDEDEAAAYETHLAGGCEPCSGEASSYRAVVANLGFAVEMEAPAEATKERLAARIASDVSSKAGKPETVLSASNLMRSIRKEELEWQEVTGGIFIKQLSVDEASGIATSLVKMLPGKRLARHKHHGSEQLFILEGDCYIHGEKLGPGDYHIAGDGSIHDSTYTVGGTTFLLIAPVTYEFLD